MGLMNPYAQGPGSLATLGMQQSAGGTPPPMPAMQRGPAQAATGPTGNTAPAMSPEEQAALGQLSGMSADEKAALADLQSGAPSDDSGGTSDAWMKSQGFPGRKLSADEIKEKLIGLIPDAGRMAGGIAGGIAGGAAGLPAGPGALATMAGGSGAGTAAGGAMGDWIENKAREWSGLPKKQQHLLMTALTDFASGVGGALVGSALIPGQISGGKAGGLLGQDGLPIPNAPTPAAASPAIEGVTDAMKARGLTVTPDMMSGNQTVAGAQQQALASGIAEGAGGKAQRDFLINAQNQNRTRLDAAYKEFKDRFPILMEEHPDTPAIVDRASPQSWAEKTQDGLIKASSAIKTPLLDSPNARHIADPDAILGKINEQLKLRGLTLADGEIDKSLLAFADSDAGKALYNKRQEILSRIDSSNRRLVTEVGQPTPEVIPDKNGNINPISSFEESGALQPQTLPFGFKDDELLKLRGKISLRDIDQLVDSFQDLAGFGTKGREIGRDIKRMWGGIAHDARVLRDDAFNKVAIADGKPDEGVKLQMINRQISDHINLMDQMGKAIGNDPMNWGNYVSKMNKQQFNDLWGRLPKEHQDNLANGILDSMMHSHMQPQIEGFDPTRTVTPKSFRKEIEDPLIREKLQTAFSPQGYKDIKELTGIAQMLDHAQLTPGEIPANKSVGRAAILMATRSKVGVAARGLDKLLELFRGNEAVYKYMTELKALNPAQEVPGSTPKGYFNYQQGLIGPRQTPMDLPAMGGLMGVGAAAGAGASSSTSGGAGRGPAMAGRRDGVRLEMRDGAPQDEKDYVDNLQRQNDVGPDFFPGVTQENLRRTGNYLEGKMHYSQLHRMERSSYPSYSNEGAIFDRRNMSRHRK